MRGRWITATLALTALAVRPTILEDARGRRAEGSLKVYEAAVSGHVIDQDHKKKRSSVDIDATAGNLQRHVKEKARDAAAPARRFWPWKPRCKACKALIDYQDLLQRAPHPAAAFVLAILWAGVLMWWLGTTAAVFFVPSLIYWAQRLQLSQEVAGATLLAFGNSAPDIFSAAAAADQEDPPLALTELLGGNAFILCIVGGTALFFGQLASPAGSQLAKQFCGGRFEQKIVRRRSTCVPGVARPETGCAPTTTDMEQLSRDELSDSRDVVTPQSYIEVVIGYVLAQGFIMVMVYDGSVSFAEALFLPLIYAAFLCLLVWRTSRSSGRSTSNWLLQNESEKQLNQGDDAPPLAGLFPPEEDGTPLECIRFAVEWPTYAIRWATIPPADLVWDRTRRIASSLTPIGLTLFWLATSEVVDPHSLSRSQRFGLAAAAITSSVAIFFGSDDGPALPVFYPALTFLAQVSSVLWLSVVARELTALIEAVGFVLEVPRLALATTAMSWGNGSGDLFASIAMARKGHLDAAISAVFAVPLLNDLVGFGMLLALSVKEGDRLVLWNGGCPRDLLRCLLLASGCVLVAMSVLTAVLSAKRKRLHYWSLVLFTLYAVFLVVVLQMEQVQSLKTLPENAVNGTSTAK
eukprot:gnl/TRDRNA2_/TRDRNA2_130103_c0_seq1.p1 gnl/TRDRNA2_/TRDRNA2_130103_c0~~gnl/TRDRNA2_/TRDRNA2_130103_c0_seq1.p1  ORF type:complete len:635 (-),score=106.13 gnl/TRDRNA2_/TRDRNA2_130103_c0_seq1:47-1951(-)